MPSPDPWEEKIANLVIGLNVFGWAIAGLAFSEVDDRWTVVRQSIAALHITVGALFISRKSINANGSTWQIAAAIPSLIACGFAFIHSPAPRDWPWFAEALFALATLFAIVSLASLGKNFAVLPALRSIHDRGPYRWIRHPAYAGELTMVFACVLASPNRWTIGALVAVVPFIMLRIAHEEQLLMSDPAYQRYSEETRWRLVPRIW